MNLGGGETVFPLAEALRARGVPFVFATGYGILPSDGYPDTPLPTAAQPNVGSEGPSLHNSAENTAPPQHIDASLDALEAWPDSPGAAPQTPHSASLSFSQASEAENRDDALALATLMRTLQFLPQPLHIDVQMLQDFHRGALAKPEQADEQVFSPDQLRAGAGRL